MSNEMVTISVPKVAMPDDAELTECFVTDDGKVVVMHGANNRPREEHNCDMMGCGSVGPHVFTVIPAEVAEAFAGYNNKAPAINAAPDLLEACKDSLRIARELPCECDEYYGVRCGLHEWRQQLEYAITKAKGENNEN